jgi:hypothetical protein
MALWPIGGQKSRFYGGLDSDPVGAVKLNSILSLNNRTGYKTGEPVEPHSLDVLFSSLFI